MKILLFGEYSGFHNNLKIGLEKMGHIVDVASSGDGFKNITSGISLGDSSPSIRGKLSRIIIPFVKLNQFKGYDVTQFVNSNPLTVCQANIYLYKKILSFSNKNFLSACGDDPVFFNNLNKFSYNPYSTFEDLKLNKLPNFNETYENIHNSVVEKVDGIIPVMIEYALGYKENPKVLPTIALPIDTNSIDYRDNQINNKVHFFHGLNRPFFKGTPIISEALKKLQSKYPNDVKITIAGNMSQTDYLSLLDRANVVLDQCKGYSYGMNALYSLSKGKIVMSGSEPEALEELLLRRDQCPVINIQPDIDQIYQQLLVMLENKKNFIEMGYNSRLFVENHHDCKLIADKYINTWA
jgi:glycosyltransferase involved in cell wall biosynthesis